MRIKYSIIILIMFLGGCYSKEYEQTMPTNTFYENEDIEEYSKDSETIMTDEENVQIDAEESKRYDNGIFFDMELYNDRAVPVYFLKEENGELVKQFTWFDSGCAFEIIYPNTSTSFLKSADHIELFKTNDNSEAHILGWFEYRIVIDGYVYYLDGAGLMRTNLDGSERELLEVVNRQDIRYKDGYIYYPYGESGERTSSIYRIKLDGIEKEKVSSVEGIDYCLTAKGALHLVENSKNMSIIYEEFGEDKVAKKLGEFANEQYHIYQVIGMIDNTIYLSVTYARTIIETGKVEIYAYKDDELELIHISSKVSDIRSYKPFIHEDCIYYITADGLFEFNPEDKNSILVAKSMFAFSKIK